MARAKLKRRNGPWNPRHSAAALHLAAGADMKIVQELLGHSTIVLTADTYTSVLPDMARTAAALIPTPLSGITSTRG